VTAASPSVAAGRRAADPLDVETAATCAGWFASLTDPVKVRLLQAVATAPAFRTPWTW
jgi:hypothetical protein